MRKIFIFVCIIFLCMPVFSIAQTTGAFSDVSQISLVMKYKDISHNWRVINKMKNQAKSLSEEEKAILKKYVFGAVKGENTYLYINCNLRNNLELFMPKKQITKPLRCRLDYYAKQMSMPISKTKLPQNMILYRGVDEKGIKLIFANKNISNYINKPVTEENLKFVKKILVGAIYEEKGFMSTSYDITCAKQTKFMFEISAPKNLQAVLMEDLGKKQEKEILVNYNTKWEVTDVTIEKSKKTKKDFYKIKVKSVLK